MKRTEDLVYQFENMFVLKEPEDFSWRPAAKIIKTQYIVITLAPERHTVYAGALSFVY